VSPSAGAPTLSVVIPYYRGAATIAEAVESVLAQTRPADEIVICDDGSPDDLEAALGPLRGDIKVVRKENGGISSAMNATTEAASGEFVVQLDQDDAFLPRRLEAIEQAARERPDADIVATDAFVEYGGETVVTLGEVHPFLDGDQRLAIIGSCFFLWPAIRRSRLIDVGGYDESLPVMQDWECFIRLILAGARVAWVDEPLYRWRLTSGSRSSRDGVANAEALIRMATKTLENPGLSAEERAAARRALASHTRKLATERAHLAVEGGGPGARRRSLELVLGRGFSRGTRVKAAAAVVSPSLARRFISKRQERNPGADALVRRGFPRPTLH
jgi:glycosyltransferase involved in cell wall biosynthesis